MTETITVPLYTGSALATGLTAPDDPNWINGTPQRYPLDVSQLKSGTYWIWLEADDERNTPIRVYAPEPIVVDHGASWEESWTANMQVTPTYRGLDVQWERHSHPDVDSYLLRLGTAPLSVTEVITVGNFISTTLFTLDPGQPYYLSIVAQDEEGERVVLSEEVMARPDVASFDISGHTDLALVGGLSVESMLRLTTAFDPYPEEVGLYAGELPDGIQLLFEQTVVTPTITGVAVPVTISTTQTLVGGQYTVPIVASGGGVTRTLSINVTILEPRFALSLSPAAVTLGEDESATVVVSASGVNEEEDPIWLNLAGAPLGLDSVFSSEVVTPSTDVTLTLTDTDMLAHGQYELYIEGEDGENTERITLTLNIYQPSFALETADPRLTVSPGETSALTLDVMAQNGWSKPITVSLDPQSIPAQTTIGFLTDPPDGVPQPEITVTPSSSVSLVVETTQNTPEGLYLLTINAHSGEHQQAIVLELLVENLAAGPGPLYLPIMMR